MLIMSFKISLTEVSSSTAVDWAFEEWSQVSSFNTDHSLGTFDTLGSAFFGTIETEDMLAWHLKLWPVRLPVDETTILTILPNCRIGLSQISQKSMHGLGHFSPIKFTLCFQESDWLFRSGVLIDGTRLVADKMSTSSRSVSDKGSRSQYLAISI